MATLKVPVYSMTGEQVGDHELNPKIFGIAFNDHLVHQAVVAQRASGRVAIAHTKGRGDVRGGGKKPWRQKGTGRARHGSRRSPIWVGGGVTFGPTKERNFALMINKKVRRQAVRMALSEKVKHERFIIVDELSIPEGKTKQLNAAFLKLPSKRKRMTLITDPSDSLIIRASKNLPNVQSLNVGSLNAVDLLKNEFVVIPKKLIMKIEKQYVSV